LKLSLVLSQTIDDVYLCVPDMAPLTLETTHGEDPIETPLVDNLVLTLVPHQMFGKDPES
jgi:hypothetical protein